MRITLVGGTGHEGRGLALRWARAGHAVTLASRDPERARGCAAELGREHGIALAGAGHVEALCGAEVAVIAVPYAAHRDTLEVLRPSLDGCVVIDVTVPLRPPKVREVFVPEAGSAALEAREVLGAGARIAATLHHVSAEHLADAGRAIDGDVLVCADDGIASEVAMSLVGDLGLRAIDAGPLVNAVALEALTPVLLHVNRRYGARAGIRITGLAEDAR